jgi:hypothetical protein
LTFGYDITADCNAFDGTFICSTLYSEKSGFTLSAYQQQQPVEPIENKSTRTSYRIKRSDAKNTNPLSAPAILDSPKVFAVCCCSISNKQYYIGKTQKDCC